MGGSRFPSLHDCSRKRPEAENKILTIVFNIVKIYIHHSHVQYTHAHRTGGYVRTEYDERATINRTALGRVVAIIYITAYSVETQMDGTNNIIIIIIIAAAETIVCLDGGYTRFYFIFG